MTPGRTHLALAALATALILAGCSSTSSNRGGGYYKDDGPGRNIPANIEAIPDAVPRIETHSSGARRPYTIFGKTYRPLTSEQPFRQEGRASWYGRKFHGKKTASGETYDMYSMTAAHPTLPIPSYARVTRVGTGRSVIVRVNDRGPFHSSRIIDLSYVAAAKLDLIGPGSGQVVVEAITNRDIAQAQKEGRSFVASPAQKAPTLTARNELPAPSGSVRVQEVAAASTEAAGTSAMTQTAVAQAMPVSTVPISATVPEIPDALAALNHSQAADVAVLTTSSSTGSGAVAVTTTPRAASVNAAHAAPVSSQSVGPTVGDILSQDEQINAQLTAVAGSDGVFLQFGAFSGQQNAQALATQLNRQIGQIEHRSAQVQTAGNLYKVQIGPYASRTEAVNAAVRIQEQTGKNPTIVAIR